ncbi:MAG TPA: CHASE domain-containing protein [Gemmatimonadales bacterium]
MTVRTRLPLVVFLASLALSLAAALVVAVTGHARDEARFENATIITRARIQSRLGTYVTILQAGNALFSASDRITADEFRAFVDAFDIERHYPGIQGIGFTAYLQADRVDSLERAMRAAGNPEFRVWPDTARPVWTSILYLEPMDDRNRAAIGYDMFSDSVRREAMIAARDSAVAVLSGRVRLVQEIRGPEQAGFLIYDPVYAGGDTPATVEARRERLKGFVYSPFRAADLFNGIFGESPPLLAFRVYDGLSTDESALLYDSRSDSLAMATGPGWRPAFVRVDTMPFHGHQWTVEYSSLPTIEERSGRIVAPAIALGGVVVSVLLFLLTRAEVRARARAERSEQARSRFYAAMSHELRTPLNAIIGYNDLLLAGIYGDMAPQQMMGIERSQKAARHLLDVVNDVLDLSKMEAGKVELEEGEVYVPSLVEDLFTTMRTYADDHGSELRMSCADGTGPIVSDARRVRQILLNLIANAIKFGRGRPVEVRCHPGPDDGVVIDVVDQGAGIAPEHQERIFEEFVQIDNSSGTGTGLGLPISRRLTHLLGGTLQVRSEPGRGSTFRVELPGRIPE